jgi:hypothetical protein
VGYCSFVQEAIPLTSQGNLERRRMMTPPSSTAKQLVWTRLGLRMGYTRNSAQRMEILDAIERMTWIDMVAETTYLAGPVARAMSRSILRDRRGHQRLSGVAELDGGRRLIGLDDGCGARQFVLDLDAEAIVLLAEIDQSQHRRGSAVPTAAATSRPARQTARRPSTS